MVTIKAVYGQVYITVCTVSLFMCSVVWSLLANGTLIAWNPYSREKMASVSISVSIWLGTHLFLDHMCTYNIDARTHTHTHTRTRTHTHAHTHTHTQHTHNTHMYTHVYTMSYLLYTVS